MLEKDSGKRINSSSLKLKIEKMYLGNITRNIK
jgi:hypothetical protein